MKPYKKIDVSEAALEDLVRRYASLIEDGLVYVDRQKPTGGGRLDVLMVDSGKSLVVGELKVVQDDGMLLQGLDYSRRKHYLLVTYNADDEWTQYAIKDDDDLEKVKRIMQAAMDRREK